ncbi:NUDIX hydrolase [Metabacillus schmidteae]|uniref:NUDIX hydrolase n=1 Tax=Metabacillus schmidteae TaxID=2730405 RepID=UPI00158D5AD1|nr:NUDIX domain-containing protein [Metabacillus schmidteae]
MGEQEKLKIYDDQRNQIGVATRSDVHKLGFWHEAFHCWFVQNDKGIHYIYLQLRSKKKKDYPNLFDITAAGHLLADETVEDGVREIKEEIGIDVNFDDLIPLGELKYCVVKNEFIDKELANVFLYKNEEEFDDFTLQAEEVAGIVRVEFTKFSQLWFGERNEVEIFGFEINNDGKKVEIKAHVNRDQFVPHEVSFYKEIIQRIQEQIK